MPRIRTGYSFRAAAGQLTTVMDQLQACGYPAAPITDRSSTFGWVRWNKLCQERSLKPVFGVELAVTGSWAAKKPAVDYWTFIAVDDIEPINRLTNLATQQFRYEPLLTYEDANAADGVFKIVGARSQLDKVEVDERTFLALSPSVARGYLKRALKAGLPLAACSDNKFPRAGDQGFYEIVCGRNASTQTYDQHIQTEEEWRESISRLGLTEDQIAQAQANGRWIMEQSNAELRQATLVKPPRPKTLQAMCEEGAERLDIDLSDPDYSARLSRELELIKAKEFEDYFYLVAEICQWARERMIVGPARGSSAGSLVCYLTGITTVDPLKHGLIFERFIDLNRTDLPDIDIDFSDQLRYMVFEHINQLYGRDHVARLGTVSMFKARSAIQDAGAALKVPKWKCDAVADSLIERSSADSRAMLTLADTLESTSPGQDVLQNWPEIKVATEMEGHPRHPSQHAAGIVISDQPLLNYVAVDSRVSATMCDKEDAEKLNLLKIDALGLTQLSVFEDALEMAGLPHDTLDKLPLDDRAALDVINQRKFSGIFQFTGKALQSLAKQVKVDFFEDIVALTALARPGPLATGAHNQWISRRMGKEKPSPIHPMLDEVTKNTYGIVCYQEQVMRIVREMGQMSWEDTSSIRKAMSKRYGNEFFENFKKKFVAGAVDQGVNEENAIEVWNKVNTFGAWAFNRSHAVSYGLVSYYCCWLKAHYPFEFAAATLSHENDSQKQITLLREMRDEGFDYVPVDPEQSRDKWAVGEREGKSVLVGPLTNVHGIGPKNVKKVMECREKGEPIPPAIQKKLANPVTPIDSLWPIADAFKRIMPDPGERNIFTPPTPIKDLQEIGEDTEALLFCTILNINPRDENEDVLVARRGYEVTDGMTESLNLQLADDTDVIFGKVTRYRYKQLGLPIVNRGRVGKALYAMKGVAKAGSFRIFLINNVRYIGDMDQKEQG